MTIVVILIGLPSAAKAEIQFCSSTNQIEVNEMCEAKKSYFRHQLAATISVKDLMSVTLANHKPILLIGEEHGDYGVEKFSTLLPLAKNFSNRFNCLAL